jgi:ATP-dependent DNA helicase RecG
LGSGIKRALEDWPEISFTDDQDACQFIATVHRKGVIGSDEVREKPAKSSEQSLLGSEQSSEKILQILKGSPLLTAKELGVLLGITSRAVEKQIAKLRNEGRLLRVGSTKGGRWEIIEDQGRGI